MWKGKYHSALSLACTILTTNSWLWHIPSTQVLNMFMSAVFI